MITYKNVYGYVYIHRLLYTHTSLLYQLGGPRSNNASVATSTSCTQILVPNFSPIKETRGPWKIADSKTGERNIKDKPGISCSPRK